MSIEVKNLTKYYGKIKALDGVSFTVEKGSVTGFLGPNGAGKTTTMRIITGIISADQGQVLLDGYTVEHALKGGLSIGYLPENNPLYGNMLVADFLLYMAKLADVPQEKQWQAVEHVARMCGLSGYLGRSVGSLSKGYRQRVGLAQALINDPQIVILDEPMNGLDPNQIIEIRQLIREVGKQKTVLLSSHVLSDIEAVCDKIIIIDKGKIVADDNTANLKQRTQKFYTYKVALIEPYKAGMFTKLGVNVEKITQNEFLLSSQNDNLGEEIFKFCAQNDIVLTLLQPVEQKLEDVFRKLTH